MQPITYQGHLVAMVDGDRVRLWPEVELGDPSLARFVLALAAYALNPDRRASGEPFDQGEAEFLARWLLMPNAAFAPLAHLPNEHLAELFEVPLAEVARKRDDLARLAMP